MNAFPPVPTEVQLYHNVLRARRQLARIKSDLEHAALENKFAEERLVTLEAELLEAQARK